MVLRLATVAMALLLMGCAAGRAAKTRRGGRLTDEACQREAPLGTPSSVVLTGRKVDQLCDVPPSIPMVDLSKSDIECLDGCKDLASFNGSNGNANWQMYYTDVEYRSLSHLSFKRKPLKDYGKQAHYTCRPKFPPARGPNTHHIDAGLSDEALDAFADGCTPAKVSANMKELISVIRGKTCGCIPEEDSS